MLELKINCENASEARVYLNAQEYLNLITDMYANFRNAQKHGTDQDLLKVVENFMPDLAKAMDHNDGAY